MIDDPVIPPYPNPFNAGFGVDPPYVAGRQAILHRLLANLQDGPGRATYVAVVVGGRGVGKTVLLNQVRDHVTNEFAWTTIRWTAGPDSSLSAAIDDAYDGALAALKGRGRGRLGGGSVGLNAGVVRADLKLAAGTHRPATVAGQLRRLGQAAADANRHVIVLVDELQAGNPASLHALSTTLQETNGERLPVGLVAAGLPTLPARLRAVGGVTFLERQRLTRLGNLERGDARDALERPLTATGRPYDPGILPIMLDAANGYPYALQLVGERTWDAAGDAAAITIEHARQGVTAARNELDALYEGRWAQLSPAQQDYLIVVVEHLQPNGAATSGDVAAALGRSTPQVSKQREALITRHQLLYADGQNTLRIALPGLADWVRTHHRHPPHQARTRGGDYGR